MSIAMERFSSEGHFATYDASHISAATVAMFQLQCRRCGYEPAPRNATPTVAPRCCPKCHGGSWERIALPGSILEAAQRH